MDGIDPLLTRYRELHVPKSISGLKALQRRKDNGYLFSVTLSRPNKKDPGKEMVVLFPHEPYICPTALEARHWGATYALYRVSNQNVRLFAELTCFSFAMEFNYT